MEKKSTEVSAWQFRIFLQKCSSQPTHDYTFIEKKDEINRKARHNEILAIQSVKVAVIIDKIR